MVLTAITLMLLQGLAARAQIQTGEPPVSRQFKATLPEAPLVQMPEIDHHELRAEALSGVHRKKLHFARVFQVSLDVTQKARQQKLAGGSLYRLRIRSEDAYSLLLVFGEYHLPPGAKLFVYNRELGHVRGAFTASNNKRNRVLPVAAVKGDEVVVEYFEPDEVAGQSRLKLTKVAHDYIDVLKIIGKRTAGFDDSGECNYDVNCPPGDNWQQTKQAVVMVTTLPDVEGTLCSGSLINNTRSDGHPYYQTANHCISSPNQVDEAVFYFNYEATENLECGEEKTGGSTVDPRDQTMAGATLVSTPPETDQLDFTLLDLNDTIPPHYRPFFAGWSLDTSNIIRTTTIHHPNGDVKKITKDEDPPVRVSYPNEQYDANSHWLVESWSLGTTEIGSSGAPLFNQDQKIIGDLTGGEASCGYNFNDYFAMISRSWDDFGQDAYQLEHWLNPERLPLKSLRGHQPYDSVPSNVSVSVEQGNDLRVDWNPTYNPGQVDYYVVWRNQQLIDSVAATHYTDPGLQEDSAYTYRIRAKLSSDGYTPYSVPAAYEISSEKELPFMEDFASIGNFPAGWYEQRPSLNKNWSMSEGAEGSSLNTGASGAYNLFFNGGQGDSSLVVTPRLNLQGKQYPYLIFYRAQPSVNGSHDHLEVFMRFGDSLPWIPLKSYTTAVEDWKRDTLYLPNPVSGYRLAFAGTGKGGGGVLLDHIRVEEDSQAFMPSLKSDKTRTCAGEDVFFEVDTTDTFEQYSWDFGYGANPRYVEGYGPHAVTYDKPGVKTVELTINGAYQQRRENVLRVDTLPPKPDIQYSLDTTNKVDTLFIDAQGMIQWYYQDEPIPGAEDDTLIASQIGVYKVQVTNSYGCSVFSDTLHVSGFDTIDNKDDDPGQQMTIYPNPSGGTFNLEVEVEEKQEALLQVINTIGKVVHEEHYQLLPGSNIRTFNGESLSDGLYLVRMTIGDRRTLKGKIIKE